MSVLGDLGTAIKNKLALKANIASPTFTGVVTAPTFSGSLSGNAATATNVAWSGITAKPTSLSGYGITDSVKNFGTVTVQGVAGSNQSCTTDQFITWLSNIGALSQSCVMKCTWDYGGNNNISDTGFDTLETAGCFIQVMSDGANYIIRITSPSTGPGAGGIHEYINHGTDYSPGWRRVYTSNLNGNITGNAATATTAANATKLNGQNWYWSGQGGQPSWLWGGNDGANMYVYNPSNFSVNYATSATYAATAAVGTNDTQIATTAFVANAVTSSVPVSTIIAIANGVVPTGFLECNGATISRSTYSALFSKISTLYGAGNGSTTFAIPDLRGEFIRGFDNGRGIDSGRTLGTQQGYDWKGFYMMNTGRNTTSYSHDEVYHGKSTTGYNGNTFVGAWSAPAAALGTKWDTSEIRPRNVAMMYCIKY